MPWSPQKLNYSHQALVEQIIANPAATNQQLGDVFGRSAQWVILVKSSDMFKEVYAARAKELFDPLMTASIGDRLEMMTSRSLEILNEKLARPAADVPDNLALAAAALGAKGMALGGFSSRPAPPPEAPQADRIERLAHRLLHLNAPSGEVVEANFREVPVVAQVGA